MKYLNKKFCFWLISAEGGKVKKFKISYLKIFSIAFLIIAFTCGTTILAHNYARLRLKRQNDKFAIAELRSESAELHKDKKSLRSKVRDLRGGSVKAQEEVKAAEEYKKDVEERLQKLQKVLETAWALGVYDASAYKVNFAKQPVQGGIGGLEVACSLTSGCPDISWDKRSRQAVIDLPVACADNAVEILDQYISAIRKMPISWPAKGKLSSFYGSRLSPFGKSVKFHQGIDISLRKGSPVTVAADGVVEAVKYDSNYGYYVDVRHSKRVVTRYAHLSKALVKKGDRVEMKSLIALSGSSGRSTGAHLHYEVRVNGAPKNPIQLLNLGKNLRQALTDTSV